MSWADAVDEKEQMRTRVVREIVHTTHEAIPSNADEDDERLIYLGVIEELTKSLMIAFRSHQSRDMLLAMAKEQKGIQS